MFSRRPPQPSTSEAPETVLIPVITVRTLVLAGLAVLAILGLALVLRQVGDTILLFLVAIVFAEGIRPAVKASGRYLHLPQVAAIILVYVVLIAVVVVLVDLLVQPIVTEANNLKNNAQTYVNVAQPAINRVEAALNLQQQNIDLAQQAQNYIAQAGQVALSVGGAIVGLVVNIVIVLLLGFLWLVTSDRLKAFVVDLVPPHNQALASSVLGEIGFRMGGYLRATGFNMLVVGVLSGIASWLLGLPSPILLGIFAGLMGAIPLVGPFIGAVPMVLLGFTIGPAYPLLVIVVVAVVQLLDANLVLPQVMNRVVALPALAVVLALLIGGTLAGIVGALLAIPLAAALQVLILRVVVPIIHVSQGRIEEATIKAQTPVSPALRNSPAGG